MGVLLAACSAGEVRADLSGPCPPPGAKPVPQQVIVRTALRVVTARACPVLEYRISGADGKVDYLCPVAQVSQVGAPGIAVSGGTTTIALMPGAYWTECTVLSIERASCGAAGIVEVLRAECADEN